MSRSGEETVSVVTRGLPSPQRRPVGTDPSQVAALRLKVGVDRAHQGDVTLVVRNQG